MSNEEILGLVAGFEHVQFSVLIFNGFFSGFVQWKHVTSECVLLGACSKWNKKTG
jgi:hypothetical protein